MTTSLHTAGPALAADTRQPAALRSLYYVRAGFALVWAGLLLTSGPGLTSLASTLLVVYPLFDLVAVAHDFRRSRGAGPRGPLAVNIALSLFAAVGLAVAVGSGVPEVLRVWGAWAITAGLLQLVVAVQRHRLGGQWAMIFSGGLSTVAGAGFAAMASGPEPSVTALGGYAALGGLFFLVSAMRLHRAGRA